MTSDPEVAVDALPSVNLDDIPENAPVLAEDKLYLVEVKESTRKMGKESGEPYINLKIEVMDDPIDEGFPMYDILPLPSNMKQGEEREAFVKRTARRCNRMKRAVVAFAVKSTGTMSQQELTEQFIGRRAWCRVKTGKDQNNNDQSRPVEYYPEANKPASV
jgi:hypothetical protein